jgi:hypothetical protein
MGYTYYEVKMFENKNDTLENPPFKGRIKVIKWLKFAGEDSLDFDKEVESESLAMKILIQNLQMVEHTFITSNNLFERHKFGDKRIEIKNENDLREIIQDRYEKVLVSKYMSNTYVK